MSSRVPAAAVLTGAAGLIHTAAAVTHVGETVLLGLLFAFAGWAQMITAVWLSASHSRAALTVMSVTNVAALAGWVMSRTVGLPVLHPGVEAAGTADVLTALLEVLALAAALNGAGVRGPEHTARRAVPIGLAVSGLLALGASGVAVAALGSAGGHGHGEEVSMAGEDEPHGHEGVRDGEQHESTQRSRGMLSRQPGTLPAALHRHRPGIYHLHDDIDLHHHRRGIVHVHTTKTDRSRSGGSPSEGTDGSGDHHEDGTDHTH